MFPILDAEAVKLVSELRAAVYVGHVDPDRRVVELVDRFTPDFQHDSTPRFDDNGPIIEVMTCGTCGRSWDDALVSSITPVPSGRCPFEYDHVHTMLLHNGWTDGAVRVTVREGLEADSNDAEHDALSTVAEAIGVDWTVPDDN